MAPGRGYRSEPRLDFSGSSPRWQTGSGGSGCGRSCSSGTSNGISGIIRDRLRIGTASGSSPADAAVGRRSSALATARGVPIQFHHQFEFMKSRSSQLRSAAAAAAEASLSSKRTGTAPRPRGLLEFSDSRAAVASTIALWRCSPVPHLLCHQCSARKPHFERAVHPRSQGWRYHVQVWREVRAQFKIHQRN